MDWGSWFFKKDFIHVKKTKLFLYLIGIQGVKALAFRS